MKLNCSMSSDSYTKAILEILKSNPKALKKKPLLKWIFPMICILILFILTQYLNLSQIIIASILSFVLILIWNFFIVDTLFNTLFKMAAKFHVRRYPALINANQILTIEDSMLVLLILKDTHKLPIENIFKVMELKEHICIVKPQGAIFTIIPTSAFKDTAEKDMFMKMLGQD